jgi:hypothetical protein
MWQWRPDAIHVSLDEESFGQSVALRVRMLVVGVPKMNEDDLWLDGVDNPGSVKIYHGAEGCPTQVTMSTYICLYTHTHTHTHTHIN